jgi:hypothetical protein
VQPPMSVSLQTLRNRFPGRRLPEALLKSVATHLLLALDFLHVEARVIHTGKCVLESRFSLLSFIRNLQMCKRTTYSSA